MVFVTYAQNFEDLMLFRALGNIERGFYIDVGANLPEAESVTKAFYDRNWSGVNIEPEEETFLRLAAARPRDINIAQACWREAGVHTLYLVEESAAFSTLEPGMAELHRQAGRKVREILLETTTLRDVCAEHVGTRPIHFLKVDVEGGELGVFSGGDFTRWRPWIILSEAHGPDFLMNVYQPWEDLLHQFSYRFVYTDGLNRFYLAEEHYDQLSPAFRCPPNVYDNWVRASEIAATERAERAERMCAEIRGHHENAKRRIECLEAEQSKALQPVGWRIPAPLQALLRKMRG